MDGTRDRPPGKNAENWSRRDGIRAGSVSGPWRSAPREEPEPGPAKARPASVRPGTAPTREPVAPVATARLVARRSFVMWVALGVAGGVAIVLAAVLMRPGPRDVPVAAAPEPVAEATFAESPGATVAVASDPALGGVGEVRLRVGPEFPAEREALILEALRDAGITGVRVEALPFRIATSRVGYYRNDDLAAAEALGRLVTPVLSESIGVRDYGKLLSDPEPGRLDLWVES